MCGLAGYVYFGNKREPNNEVILSMLKLQKHRGPDDSGITVFNTDEKKIQNLAVHEVEKTTIKPNVVFGFNRLSILDVSINGHQPMVGLDGKVTLMLNGEVYNAFDFTEDLKTKGHVFKSTSDTEVVLNLYLEYGLEGMIQRLNGMFAIVIMDLRYQHLFLVRDRFGIKPLYILRDKDYLAFASEMKSFKAMPGFNFELNPNFLDEYLIFRNVINKTLFKNIINLTPGTYLSVSMNSGNVQEHQYYDLNLEGGQLSSKDETELLLSLSEKLRQSVSRQMLSDVKLGTQLSGGVDSSLVTYYASKILERDNLESISITFDDPKFSEENYIDQVSNQLNLKSHKYKLDASYYFENIEKATWHFEHPINHPNTIGIYLLSQEAKKHVTVLLSGEGADEILAGYSRFANILENPFLSKSFWGGIKRNGLQLLTFLNYYKDLDKRMIMESSFGNIEVTKALKPDFNFNNAIKQRLRILKNLKGNTNLRQRKYEILTYLPDLLMRQDKMSMAHSIENRVPFLDNKFVTTALNIPKENLLKKRNDKIEPKFALKQVCAVAFNDKFAFRLKQGFGIPLREFMSTPEFQKKWTDDIAPKIEDRAIFDYSSLNNWMENVNTISPPKLEGLWLSMSFEIWAQQYLD